MAGLRILSGGRRYEALRWHCGICGRLVRPASVSLGYTEDADAWGECSTCGRTEVVGDWTELRGPMGETA